jgi:hypothetical protein
MYTRTHMFERELKRLIEIEIERLKENMSLGLIDNHEEYRLVAGKIAGLRLAVEYMAEAEAICDGKPRE